MAAEKKRGSLCRNWCFTLNNYTDEEYENLLKCDYGYIIIGKEKGKEGTPHLQGYVQLEKKQRLPALKKINPRAHWEAAKGSPEDNKKYCSKDGDFEERGNISTQGKKKCDLKDCVEMTLNKDGPEAIMEKHGNGYIMHKRKIDELAAEINEARHRKSLKIAFQFVELRPWQDTLKKIIDQQIKDKNDRSIVWIYDPQGNNGKSWFSKYVLTEYEDSLLVRNGRSMDIAYQYNYNSIVIFDLVRSSQDHVNYEIIEQIKDGIVNSTKYMSKMKITGTSPVVIVMSNQFPNREKMSDDRWLVKQIIDGELIDQ